MHMVCEHKGNYEVSNRSKYGSFIISYILGNRSKWLALFKDKTRIKLKVSSHCICLFLFSSFLIWRLLCCNCGQEVITNCTLYYCRNCGRWEKRKIIWFLHDWTVDRLWIWSNRLCSPGNLINGFYASLFWLKLLFSDIVDFVHFQEITLWWTPLIL